MREEGNKRTIKGEKRQTIHFFCSSGSPENVPTVWGDFRRVPKMRRRCGETFGEFRKRAGSVGRLSGSPENVPTVRGDFRGSPKKKKLKIHCLHLFTFSPF